MSRKKKQSIIADALKDPELLSNLAMAMTAPLRQRRDYSGIARRAFHVTYPCDICLLDFEEETQPIKVDYRNQQLRLTARDTLDKDTLCVCVTCLGACVTAIPETFSAPLRDMPKLIHSKNPLIKEIALHRLKEAK